MRIVDAAARYVLALPALGLCHCDDSSGDSEATATQQTCAPQSELNDSQQKLAQATKQLNVLQDELKAFRELSSRYAWKGSADGRGRFARLR